jgi:cobalamin biosynthesis protein CobT
MSFGRSKVRLWESTLEKLARIFAEQYGVRVVFKHDLCMTDGKDIYLPVIPEEASNEFLDACHGHLDHEVSHILFTDFEVTKESKKIGKKHGLLFNALEDPWVESKMIKLWRGSKINLHNCNEWSLEQLGESWGELSEFGKFSKACCLLPTVGEDHWFTQKHIAPDKELMENINKVQDLLDQVPDKVNSSWDNLELVKQIMERLCEEDEPEPEEGAFKEVSGEQLDKDEDLLSRHEQIRKEAESEIKQAKRNSYLIWTTENDVVEFITDGDRSKTKQFLEESRSIVNALKQRFRMNLLSQTKTRWEPGKRRGRINPRVAYKIPLGTSKDVFRSKVTHPGFNTRAAMLIDHSGSMQGGWSCGGGHAPIDLAAMCALIFGENLHELNIPFEICGYSTGDYNEGDNNYYNASEAEKNIYTRWGRMWLGVYKKYEEAWASSRHRCLQMSRNGKYNTYDGESVRLMAQRLLKHPEDRKILFVLCDGYPCPNAQQFIEVHRDYLKTVTTELEKHVEVFAIGIQSDAVKEFYSNSVVVNEIRDLPVVMMSELDRLLRKGQNAYTKQG